MNRDMIYCAGQEPYEKCKTCKRFTHTFDDVWIMEPCDYLAKEGGEK